MTNNALLTDLEAGKSRLKGSEESLSGRMGEKKLLETFVDPVPSQCPYPLSYHYLGDSSSVCRR